MPLSSPPKLLVTSLAIVKQPRQAQFYIGHTSLTAAERLRGHLLAMLRFYRIPLYTEHILPGEVAVPLTATHRATFTKLHAALLAAKFNDVYVIPLESIPGDWHTSSIAF
jgi:hypothetical protein